jgi:chemotaxis regulatin CheY-phosphate phosphatase CheZ
MSATDTLHARIQNEISELTESITGMVSSFRKLQRPLVESREKVPQATNQLDKISEQTEAATAQMLDMVEQITQRDDQVVNGLQEITTLSESGEGEKISRIAADLSDKVNQNLNDAFLIMESLQFQDITAQQMDHAATLLEDIETKLQSILQTLGASSKATVKSVERKVRAFDPHADFIDKKANQEDIDSLFEQKQK